MLSNLAFSWLIETGQFREMTGSGMRERRDDVQLQVGFERWATVVGRQSQYMGVHALPTELPKVQKSCKHNTDIFYLMFDSCSLSTREVMFLTKLHLSVLDSALLCSPVREISLHRTMHRMWVAIFFCLLLMFKKCVRCRFLEKNTAAH